MSDLNHKPDALDRAVEALRTVEVPAGPSADLTDATIALVRNRLAGAVPAEVVRRHQRRRIMRYIGVGSATAVAVAAAVVASVLWPPTPASAADEFKRAMDKAAAAREVTFRSVKKLHDRAPEMTTKLYVRGPVVRVEFVNPGAPGLPDPKELPAVGAAVVDGTAGKTLHLDFVAKTARVETSPPDGKRPPFPDLAVNFRKLKDEPATPAGEEAVDGKAARVFTLKSAAFMGVSGPADVRVWIDPATQLPVKVRIESPLADPKRGSSVFVFDRFTWDDKLDDALFALTPPEGYKVREAEKPAAPEESRPGRTTFVSFRRALENQEKVGSYRAVVRTKTPNPPAGTSKEAEQKLYAQGTKFRMEYGDTFAVIAIGDSATKKMVALFPQNQTAQVMRLDASEPEMQKAMTAALKTILDRGDGVEDLGDKALNGRKAHGYRVKGLKAGDATVDVTYWVDPKRDLPVRFETITRGGAEPRTQTIDYLEFDEELDPKLFDQTIPPGYKVEEVMPAEKKE